MSFEGKRNLYLCKGCGFGFVTLDVDEGTTPFMTQCPRPECGGWAQSFMYRVPQQWLEEAPVVLEWYHPSPEEYAKLSPGVKAHVDTFRLISRRAAKP